MADDRPTEDAPRPLVPMLSYATKPHERPPTLKHAMAIAFAAIAIPLGCLFALSATGLFVRSLHETTTRESRLFRRDAACMLACGVVLIAPGVRYGRLGLRGVRAGTG